MNETYAVAAVLVGHDVSTWLIRTVRAFTASEVPSIRSPNTGVAPSLEVIWTFEVNAPLPEGWNATLKVHESPAATSRGAEAHGRVPPPRLRAKAGLEVAEKLIDW